MLPSLHAMKPYAQVAQMPLSNASTKAKLDPSAALASHPCLANVSRHAASQIYREGSPCLQLQSPDHDGPADTRCSPGRCKHNSVYWQGAPFYAFGLGAASLLQGQRFSRPRTMGAYRDWVLKQGCSIPEPGTAAL